MSRMQSVPTSSRAGSNLRFPSLAVLLLACLALMLTTAGCERGGGLPEDHKLVVIGFDAADWALIDPLVEAGRMPVMARFLEQSTAGVNMSFVPLVGSPQIWASMATGRMPDAHGIQGFVRREGDKLSLKQQWLAPAYWDLAGAVGQTSCVIGWWLTHPARDIAGVMVSDANTYTIQGFRDDAGLVRPDVLREDLAALKVDYRDITLAELGRFIDLDSLAGHEEAMASRLDKLRTMIAGDRSYLAMAAYLAPRSEFDVFSLYFRGLDLSCHTFWPYYRPDQRNEDLDPVAVAVFGEVIPNYYVYCDELLGEMLALFPDDRSVMILSDHGFEGLTTQKGKLLKGVMAHRPHGVYAVRSPLHQQGYRFDSTPIINVCPTILALMGLPASEEMPGQVIREGLTAAGLRWVEQLEGNRVASYQTLAPVYADSVGVQDESEVDEAVIRQLRSLGYID